MTRTMQEEFDIAVGSIIKQGERSYDDTTKSCMYRKNGRADCPIRCAVGHLISDDKYPAVNETSICSWEKGTITYVGLDPERVGFYDKLQMAHDMKVQNNENFITQFKSRAKDVADRYNLEWKFD